MKSDDIAKIVQEIMKNLQTGEDQKQKNEEKQKIPPFISVAEKMKSRAVNCKDDLYVHIDGCYTNDRARIDSEIQKYWTAARYKDLNEVRLQLSIRARKVDAPDKDYIAFTNGLYSIKDGALTPPTPEIFTINKIPHNLMPMEEISLEIRQKVDKFMMGFADGRTDRRKLLEEILGLCLVAWPMTRKIFFIIGDGNNGKTTFIHTAKVLLGEENISTASLDQLTSRFGTVETYGKLANLSDETVSDRPNIEILKQLSGRSTISGERKYAANYLTFMPYATIVFAGNRLPIFSGYGKAESDRCVYVRLTHDFSKEKESAGYEEIEELLNNEEAIGYMLHLSLQGLRRVIENHGDITVTEDQHTMQRMHERDSEPVIAFVEDSGGPQAFIGNSIDDVWKNFVSYFAENYLTKDIPNFSKYIFGKKFRDVTGLNSVPKRIADKTIRIYDK